MLCVGFLVLLSWSSWSAEGSSLLPFGPDHKDQPVIGDQHSYIEMEIPINLDDDQYQLVSVSKKGYMSLRKATLRFAEEGPKVSVIREENEYTKTKPVDVFFRVTNDTGIKFVVDPIVEETYGTKFESKQLLVTTWVQYGCPNETNVENMRHIKRITQCVICSDGSRSYAVYLNGGDGGCGAGGKILKDDKPCKSLAGSNCFMEGVAPLQDAPAVAQLHGDLHHGGRADALSQLDFIQLSTAGRCLKLTGTAGVMSSCNDDDGLVETNTVFRVHGSPGNEQIELFGSGQCLDREHCHSSTSNLRKSDCGHCGAIHWDLRQDGTLREDNGANCIYVVQSSDAAAVHHSTDGCTSFQVTTLGNVVQLKTLSGGDCLANGVFGPCSSAPVFAIYNLPRQYRMKDTSSGFCFDREHCHSSTSNTRLFDCGHCGALHWSIEDEKVGEDDMQNCLVRGDVNSAVMKHCSEGQFEKITCEISSVNVSSSFLSSKLSSPITGIPKPDLSVFMETIPYRQLMGARLYKDDLDGSSRLDFVHALPNQNRFPLVTSNGVFQVHYWVSTIITKVPHDNSFTPGGLLDDLISEPTAVTGVQLRYGAVDIARGYFGERDGVMSLFFTDEASFKPLPKHQMLKQLDISANKQKWWRVAPTVHYNSYNQSYFTFAEDAFIYQALFWPKV